MEMQVDLQLSLMPPCSESNKNSLMSKEEALSSETEKERKDAKCPQNLRVAPKYQGLLGKGKVGIRTLTNRWTRDKTLSQITQFQRLRELRSRNPKSWRSSRRLLSQKPRELLVPLQKKNTKDICRNRKWMEVHLTTMHRKWEDLITLLTTVFRGRSETQCSIKDS